MFCYVMNIWQQMILVWVYAHLYPCMAYVLVHNLLLIFYGLEISQWWPGLWLLVKDNKGMKMN